MFKPREREKKKERRTLKRVQKKKRNGKLGVRVWRRESANPFFPLLATIFCPLV